MCWPDLLYRTLMDIGASRFRANYQLWAPGLLLVDPLMIDNCRSKSNAFRSKTRRCLNRCVWAAKRVQSILGWIGQADIVEMNRTLIPTVHSGVNGAQPSSNTCCKFAECTTYPVVPRFWRYRRLRLLNTTLSHACCAIHDQVAEQVWMVR